MLDVDFQYIIVGFVSYMSLYWLGNVVFSFYTEFTK